MRIEGNRDAIMLLALALFVMGLECFRMAIMGGVPMPPETHGSAMYEMPAEAWAGIVIGQSGALFFGAWRRLPKMIAMAGFVGGILYLALWVMADQASLGFIVSRGAAVFGVLNTAAATAAIFDMVAHWLERQGQFAIDEINHRRGEL